MLIGRSSTSSGANSDPPSRSILLSKIFPHLASRSSKSTGTASDMPSTPSTEWTDLGRSQVLRHGGKLRRPPSLMASQTPGIPPTPRPTSDWTCDSPGSLKPTGSRTLRSNGKKKPSWHRPLHRVSCCLTLQPEDPKHLRPGRLRILLLLVFMR